MIIKYHKNFAKKCKKLLPKIELQAQRRIALFQKDPHNTQLSNHALKGKYKGFRSINITGDWRAIFKRLSSDVIMFVDIDTHSNLYS